MLSLSINTAFVTAVDRQADATQSAEQKLSSGLAINTAEDNPAGLSIANSLHSQVMGSQQAAANIQDAINLVRVGEDGISGMMPIMQRMRQLVLQASNGTWTDDQRQAMQDELDSVKQLIPQAFYVAHAARVNLDSVNNSDRILDFQVGPDSGQTIQVNYNNLRNTMYSFVLGAFGYSELYNSQWGEMLVSEFGTPAPKPTDPVPTPPPPATSPFPPGTTFDQAYPKKLLVVPGVAQNFQQSLNLIDNMQTGLTANNAYLGAMENQLQTTLTNVQSTQENLMQTESNIRDVDMAAEVTEMTKAQVLQQAAQSMLAQANSRPQEVLQLLQPSH